MSKQKNSKQPKKVLQLNTTQNTQNDLSTLRQNVVQKSIGQDIEAFFSSVTEYINYLHNVNNLDIQDQNILVMTLKNYLFKLKNVSSFDNYQTHISNLKDIIKKINDPAKIIVKDVVNALQPYDYQLFQTRSTNQEKINGLEIFYTSTILKIINNDEINNFVNHAILENSFLLTNSAKSRLNLDSLQNQNAFKATILTNIIKGNATSSDIPNVLEFFNIKLNKLTVEWKPAIYNNRYNLTSTSFVIKSLNEIWNDNSERSKALLQSFISNGLDLNSPLKQNNALTLGMEEINGTINLDLIRLLLEYGSNPNQVMSDALESSMQKFTTMAFPVAIGSTNYKLIELLLQYGADPYLPSTEASKLLKTMDDRELKNLAKGSKSFKASISEENNKDSLKTEDIDLVLLTCGLEKKIPDPQEKIQYFIALDQLIDDFFTSRIVSFINIKNPDHQEIEQKTNIDELASFTSSEEPLKSLPLEHIDEKLSANDLITSSNTDKIEKKSSDDLIARYIHYKNTAQEDKNLPEERKLEHKFDSLLLQFIKGNTHAIDEINTMLEEHPDLSGYSIAKLLNGHSQKTANAIFSYHPDLLNKYFLSKKSSKEYAKNTNSKTEKSLGYGIYEVEGRFEKNIFIKVPEEKFLSLNIPTSKLNKLKVISSTSLGENGVKFTKHYIKLKLGRTDDAFYAKEMKTDDKGRIYIEFNDMHNHAWTKQQTTPLTKTTITSQAFDNKIFEDWVDLGNLSSECEVPDLSITNTEYNDKKLVGDDNNTYGDDF